MGFRVLVEPGGLLNHFWRDVVTNRQFYKSRKCSVLVLSLSYDPIGRTGFRDIYLPLRIMLYTTTLFYNYYTMLTCGNPDQPLEFLYFIIIFVFTKTDLRIC